MLGGFVAGVDRSRSLLSQPKRLALLAYLCLQPAGAPVSRDRVLGMLWPELDDAHARGSLRKCLHLLRCAVGRDALISRGDDFLEVSASELWCDARAFTEAVAEGRDAEALGLYRGELLPGLFVEDASGFDGWLESQRSRLREAARAAGVRLVAEARGESDLRGALFWVHRLAEVVPDDEEVLRMAISLMHEAGDAVGALRKYDEFAARIRREYDLSLSPQTARLVASVRAGTAVPAQPEPARTRVRVAARTAPAPPTPLLDLLPDAVLRLDPEGCFTYVNAGAVHLFGYDAPELVGSCYLDLVCEDHRDDVLAFHLRQREERLAVTYHEFPVLRKDGRELWVGQRTRLVVSEGAIVEVVAVARDISIQRQIEHSQRNFALLDRASGLMNRRAFLLLLEQKCRLARRNSRPFGFLRLALTSSEAASVPAVVGVLRRIFRDADALARVGPAALAMLPEQDGLETLPPLVARLERLLGVASLEGTLPPGLGLRVDTVEYDPASLRTPEALLDLVSQPAVTRRTEPV